MGRFFNLFQTMPQATTRRYFGKHHFHLPLDDSKKVIEVVSDAARQLPNRLHFLSLPQLVLHLFPFRDVSARISRYEISPVPSDTLHPPRRTRMVFPPRQRHVHSNPWQEPPPRSCTRNSS